MSMLLNRLDKYTIIIENLILIFPKVFDCMYSSQFYIDKTQKAPSKSRRLFIFKLNKKPMLEQAMSEAS